MAVNASSSARRREHDIPRFLVYGAMLMVCIALVPPAIVARVRAVPSANRRIALIQDMDIQARYDTQAVNTLFADRRAMRPIPAGAVARQDPAEQGVATEGAADGQWSTTLPPHLALDASLLLRGQQRFDIYCAPCHGSAGFGDGMIHRRAQELMTNALGPVNGTTWVQPKSLHDPAVEAQPVGQIFHTISHGIRNMASYGSQVPVDDRWAIAAYVKTLQRAQNAKPSDVPPEVMKRLAVQR
ncbi:MAG: cytochrome c [Phycisphaerales bacterium]